MIQVLLSDMGVPSGWKDETYFLWVRFAPCVSASGLVFDTPDSILADLEILTHIRELYEFASKHTDKTFVVNAQVKTNPNDTLGQDLAHLFKEAGPIPHNIEFSKDVAWFVKKTCRARFGVMKT